MSSQTNPHEKTRLTRRELIDQISQDTQVRKEVVDVVLERFVDIAIEQMSNGVEFRLWNLFTATFHTMKNHKLPTAIDSTEVAPLKPYQRLVLKPSENVKKLHRLQQDNFSDKPFLVNRDTWRGALEWVNAKKPLQSLRSETNPSGETFSSTKPRVVKQSHTPYLPTEDLENPLLDDDEEY